ncbi:hypothetical protein L1787_14550 [Acuticoccus sp. M5D2P5]|uniref:hypothetical protein n=1 Tax=Acuticoccus kalidii TaxID=2910977 RepID=UPI001F26B425|nr:hypothetical protein [Acuticoccus kalidii]MCF3934622.1 hypothetical protein [Acuticoccus kalidii]
MRISRGVGSLIVAIMAVTGLATVPALAFDPARCERVRSADNATLAAALRRSGAESDEAKECYARVALLRLRLLPADAFEGDTFRDGLATFSGGALPSGPIPAALLVRLSDALTMAEPAVHTDTVRRRTLAFTPMQANEIVSLAESVRGHKVEGGAQPAVALTGGAAPGLLVAVAGDALPPGAADPETFGRLPSGAHLPRNTPQRHPRADQRVATLLQRARALRPDGCLAPSSVRDADIQRNKADLDPPLCVEQMRVEEKGVDWAFVSIRNAAFPDGPVWYLPHDDESEAFDAAVYAVRRYGGRFIAVAGPETRDYEGIDPNRAFTASPDEARACGLAGAMPAYTGFVMGHFEGAKHILTLHNNSRGGDLSVKAWDAKLKGYPVNSGPFADYDHLVFIVGERAMDEDAGAKAERDMFLGAGLNVVHERVSRQNYDCSLSNYVTRHDDRPYYNIEAVHGSTVQKGMVDAVLAKLGYQLVPGE